jgi:small subunit ribosomal protein S8
MSQTDPIADMLTMIRNALQAKKQNVVFEYSNIRKNIAEILAQESFINGYRIISGDVKGHSKFNQIEISLRYDKNGEPVIKGLERVSTPGRRVYINSRNIPVVYNHLGVAIISTNIGVITDKTARKEKVGGEYLCKVW